MADTKIDFTFNTTLTQKEFSLITRALVGKLHPTELVTASELNVRLLEQRVTQMEVYVQRSREALNNAIIDSRRVGLSAPVEEVAK